MNVFRKEARILPTILARYSELSLERILPPPLFIANKHSCPASKPYKPPRHQLHTNAMDDPSFLQGHPDSIRRVSEVKMVSTMPAPAAVLVADTPVLVPEALDVWATVRGKFNRSQHRTGPTAFLALGLFLAGRSSSARLACPYKLDCRITRKKRHGPDRRRLFGGLGIESGQQP
jgi:hypothetical protein